MYTFASPKLLTLPASLGNRDNDINTHYLPLHCVGSYGVLAHNCYGNLRLSGGKLPGPKPNFLEPKKKCPAQNSLRIGQQDATYSERDGSPNAKFLSENNVQENDNCGRHFLFDRRWKNGALRDEIYFKTSTIVSPLPRVYQVKKANNLQRISLCRSTCNSPSKPFCPLEGFDLTSFPTPLLPATSTATAKSLSVETLKHRSRISHRTCSLFTIRANQKSQSYADPVAGAAPSFIQRLSEISSLEGETIRQEKTRRIKKNRKQD